MSRRRKFVLWTGGTLLFLALAGVIAGVLVLRSAWFYEKVRMRLVREVEQASGARVELGSFQFDWRTLRTEVRAFVLHGTEPPGEAPLFRAKSITLDWKILSLLNRKTDLVALDVENPEINLLVDSAGRWNLPRPKAARGREPLETVVDLAIDRLRLRNGRVHYNTQVIPLDVRGEDFQADLAFVRDDPSYRGKVTFRRVHLESPYNMPVDLDAALEVEIGKGLIRIPSATLAHQSGRARFSGVIVPVKDVRADFRIDAEVEIEPLRRVLRFAEPHRGRGRVTGTMSLGGGRGWVFEGKGTGRGIAWRQSDVLLENIELSSSLRASRNGLVAGNLAAWAMGGEFHGSARFDEWRSFLVQGEARGLTLATLSRLRTEKPLPYGGQVSGSLRVEGAIGDRSPRGTKVFARLDIASQPGETPLNGHIDMAYDHPRGLLDFGLSHLATPSTRVTFSGSAGAAIRAGLLSSNLDDLLPAMAFFSEQAPASFPVRLDRSEVRFEGDVSGPVQDLRVQGTVSTGAFQVEGRAFNSFSAGVSATSRGLRLSRLTLTRGGARLGGALDIALNNWGFSDTSPLTGDFDFSGVALAQVLKDYQISVPLDAQTSGKLHVEGSLSAPRGTASLTLAGVKAWGEAVDRVRVDTTYENNLLRVTAGSLEAGKGVFSFSGTYRHQPRVYDQGTVDMNWSVKGFRLAQWKAVGESAGSLDGEIEGRGSCSAALQNNRLRLIAVDGGASVRGLTISTARLGDVSLQAATRGKLLHVDLNGALRDSKAQGYVEWVLGDITYGLGQVQFTNITARTLQDVGLFGGPSVDPPFEGGIDGEIGFTGPILEPRKWDGAAKITRVEIIPRDVAPAAKNTFTLRNRDPILAYVNSRGITIPGARIYSGDMDLKLAGSISFQARSPWNLQLEGALNLVVLRAWKEDLETGGFATIDAVVRGTLNQPQVSGRMELRDASFALRGVPNGLEHATGVIVFDRNRANIESLTAQTGGGDLKLSGFVGYAGSEIIYRLTADAQRIRVRYPEGVSTSLNANVQWTGSSSRSLLSGVISVNRIGISPNLDFGGLLAQSGRPLPSTSVDNELLRGMQFDVRIVTSPDAELLTSLTRDIQPEADLRLRGGPSKPVLLGRATVNQGEIRFFGNRYTITRGEVSFFNPVKLDPIMNVDLETKVRGVTVTINFTGPANRLNVSYRSDPPLQSAEIVALLTVGRTPESNVGSAAQVGSLQGFFSAGGNTLLGAAMAAPISGRLQKFFGVSRLKIDPELTGVTNTPQARLTIEQQLSREITLTYITNLNRTQQQIVRLQWDFSRDFSLLAAREENGVFGIDFQYRRRFK